jgi:hypothetical protein
MIGMQVQQMQDARMRMINNILDSIVEATKAGHDDEFINFLRQQIIILSS